MKHLYPLFLLITTIGFAQIPSGYYDSATGNGYTLKTQLKEIINTANDGLATEFFHQGQDYGDLYDAYVTSDTDNYFENDQTVLDMYSERPASIDEYNYMHGFLQCGEFNGEGQCYNREHIFPQGFFNQQEPMRSDIHHVVPSDGRVNGFRSNFPFGEVDVNNLITQSGITNPTTNGSMLGPSITSGYTGTVFEPIDEFKGDIARMLLYFAVRYEDEWNNSGWDAPTTMNNPLNGTSDQFYEDWYIDLLLDWHAGDAVSQREIDRNNVAFNFQGNRNPFIDNPVYAEMIWNPIADTEAPTNPTNLVASNPTDNSIDLNWTASTDNVAVVSYDIYIDGVNSFNTTGTSFTVPGLTADTNYCFTIKATDAEDNESGFSNQDCEMTTDNGSGGGGCATEDFENLPTSSPSSYIDRMWTGANGTWNATEGRTDETINGKAITIDCRNSSNGTVSSPPVAGGIGDLTVTTQKKFSGTDGTLDVLVNTVLVGTIPYGSSAQTTTISNINTEGNINVVIQDNNSGSSRIAIDDLSWTCYTALSLENFNLSDLKIYPNPIKENSLNIKTTRSIDVEVFDILGKKL